MRQQIIHSREWPFLCTQSRRSFCKKKLLQQRCPHRLERSQFCKPVEPWETVSSAQESSASAGACPHPGGAPTHLPSAATLARPSCSTRVGTRASGPLRAGQPSLQPQSVVSPTNSFKQALTLPLGRETGLTEAGHSMSRHPQGWRRGHQWEQTVGAAECHLGATSADIITCVRVVVAQESREGRAPTRAT